MATGGSKGRHASPDIIIPYFAGRGSRPRASWWGRAKSCCLRFQETQQAAMCFPQRYPRSGVAGSLRCLVVTGDEVLDFGPLVKLRRRLGGRVT